MRRDFRLRKKIASFFKKVREQGIPKRQKFVVGVLALTLSLYFTQYLFGKSGFYFSLFLSVLTGIWFFFCLYKDVRGNVSVQPFILPVFYTLAFGLFYFLIPSRFITRTVMAILYAFGLYSLFLSQNILVVASIRTISLLTGARIVSFVITLVSFFFLSTIVFTFHLPVIYSSILLFLCAFLLVFQSLWSVVLEKKPTKYFLWAIALSTSIVEVSIALWFWPSNPTIIALFLTGFFYMVVGISHVWFDKRLFKGVIWEYLWVAIVVFCILLFYSSWSG